MLKIDLYLPKFAFAAFTRRVGQRQSEYFRKVSIVDIEIFARSSTITIWDMCSLKNERGRMGPDSKRDSCVNKLQIFCFGTCFQDRNIKVDPLSAKSAL
jgi:hypothetical protein